MTSQQPNLDANTTQAIDPQGREPQWPVIDVAPELGAWNTLVLGGGARLWSAHRGDATWCLQWRKGLQPSVAVLELTLNDRAIWECEVAIAEGAETARVRRQIYDSPAYLGITTQFRPSDQGADAPAKRTARKLQVPAWAERKGRSLAAWARSPRAVFLTLFRTARNALALMGLIFVSYWVLQKPVAQEISAAGGGTPAPVSAAAPVAPELRDLSSSDQLTSTEMTVVVNAVRQYGIRLRPEGVPFVVFSDPNCPACRALDPQLLTADSRFMPIIVPVAFKPGSEMAVQRVLCAKDRVAAWNAAVQGAPAEGDAGSDGQCAGAPEAVLANNGAFAGLRFTSTPTIVSGLGKVVAAGAPGSVHELNQWLEKNGGASEKNAAQAGQAISQAGQSSQNGAAGTTEKVARR